MDFTTRQRAFFAHRKRRAAFASDMQHRDRVGVIAGVAADDLNALYDANVAALPAWCGEGGYYCQPCGRTAAGHCAFPTYVDPGTLCVGCRKEIGATS